MRTFGCSFQDYQLTRGSSVVRACNANQLWDSEETKVRPQPHKRHSSSTMHLILLSFLCLLRLVATQERELLWSDEFDAGAATSPDLNTWQFDIGDWGWGNGEFQNYTTDNSYIQDGFLFIECRRGDDEDDNSFTSARLKTEDRLLVRYGTIEARIRLPNVANGLWPAFWTLGSNFRTVSWPFSGEIDIMEVGQADAIVDGVVNQRVSSGVHYEHNGEHIHDAGPLDAPFRFDEDFHVYRLDWTPEFATFSVDDVTIYQADIADACGGNCTELHTPHFLIMNMAVGGGYTYVEGEPWGAERITANFPAIMQVDYVRVYQNGFAELSGPVADNLIPSVVVVSPTTRSPTSAPPITNPTNAPLLPPTSSPPTSVAPFVPSPLPTSPQLSALCSSHSRCAALDGYCCPPTSGGRNLACCDETLTIPTTIAPTTVPPTPVVKTTTTTTTTMAPTFTTITMQPTTLTTTMAPTFATTTTNTTARAVLLPMCVSNKQCNSLGLAGACCPTVSSMFLDCCESIPASCGANPDCVVYSAELYAKDQARSASGVRPGPRGVGACWSVGVGILLAAAIYL